MWTLASLTQRDFEDALAESCRSFTSTTYFNNGIVSELQRNHPNKEWQIFNSLSDRGEFAGHLQKLFGGIERQFHM